MEKGFEGGNPKQKSSVNVFNFVLMDGSSCLFAARLNSGLSPKFEEEDYENPGATITVKDHHFIWMWDESLLEFRVVMLIKDYEWIPAPVEIAMGMLGIEHTKLCLHESIVSDDTHVRSRCDAAAIDRVEDHQEIVMMNYKLSTQDGWVWTFMDKCAIKGGHWIGDPEGKRLWEGVVSDRKRAAATYEAAQDSGPETCNCQDEYDLERCVLDLFPLSRLCRMELFEEVKDRIGEVDGNSFHELSKLFVGRF